VEAVRIHGRVQAEDDIVQVAASGEGPAVRANFTDFFLDEHERLYRALYFVTGSPHEAEELMQDAFMKLWERWDRIEELDDATAYLFRVALNGFRMRARRARTAAKRVISIEPTPDPFADVDLKQDVHRMLAELSPRQRSALVLTEIFGYGSEQAAQIMGIRASTVRVLASQGRAALREP
jgi:RNA polymerase sigma factor (sigma-70 family)